MSSGMIPKSTKPKAIPRFNTTGNLLLQPSTPTISSTSALRASSSAKKRLPSSQSSNALSQLPRSRIPTPVRAREQSIATYTYSWTKTAPTKTETSTKQNHRHEPDLSGIGANITEIPSQVSKPSAKITLLPKFQTKSDVPLPVTKTRQVQCQPVINTNQAEVSSIGQGSLSRKWTAGPSQTVKPQHEASASLRPSLPLKAQSSHNLLDQRPCRETVTRAFSGGITHFSSVITLDPKHVDNVKKISLRGITSNDLGKSFRLDETAATPKKIHEVRGTDTVLFLLSFTSHLFHAHFSKFYDLLLVTLLEIFMGQTNKTTILFIDPTISYAGQRVNTRSFNMLSKFKTIPELEKLTLEPR